MRSRTVSAAEAGFTAEAGGEAVVVAAEHPTLEEEGGEEHPTSAVVAERPTSVGEECPMRRRRLVQRPRLM